MELACYLSKFDDILFMDEALMQMLRTKAEE